MYYRSEPLFPYAGWHYCVMPTGLPSRFYPENKNDIYETEHYVLCFDAELSEENRQRLIRDYAKYYDESRKNGILI